jgi:GntR family transcriptional regulator / MocR family aminotransferase
VPRDWSTSAELHLEFDACVPGRRASLEKAVRDAIHAGRLVPGSSLPSTRRLAADLGLSRGTVVEAYAQLTSEGYLVGRPGSSTSVAPGAALAQSISLSEPAPSGVESARFDLRPGLLDIGRTFPRREWLRSVRTVLASAPDSSFDYGDPRGRLELRVALARYLGRARGVAASPETIVVCQGFSHGLELAARALLGRGASIAAMEDPCLPAHRMCVKRAGLAVTGMPVEALGADVAALRASGANVAVVTPAHQYPTGVTLAAERRAQLVEWARQTGAVVIEDDYDGEFRYDRQPVGALQGLAPHEVIYIGTTSKTMAPGLRVGWMVVPPNLVQPVIDAMGPQPGGSGPPSLEQLALADFIERGRLDQHLRRLRAAYRRRRDIVLQELADVAPPLRPYGIAAGLHVTFPFTGTPYEEAAVAAAARRNGLRVAFLGSHTHAGASKPGGLVLGFARPTEPQLPEALRLLARAFAESRS